MLAIALALGASLSWGLADFVGGLKSRVLELLAVLVISQAVALGLLIGATVAIGGAPPGGQAVAYAAVAGVAAVVGTAAFYRGLAVGAMSVVAPIGGLGAVLPVLVGLAGGERPGVVRIAAVALALGGVALASRKPGRELATEKRATGIGLALVAALGFGIFLTAMDAAGDGDILWALLVSRAVSVGLLVGAALIARPDLRAVRPHVGGIVAAGTLDMGGSILYVLAATEGLVTLAAVLASLYPAVTVLLARGVLGERVGRSQLAGVALVFGGVTGVAVA